jgi:hypothetical protein
MSTMSSASLFLLIESPARAACTSARTAGSSQSRSCTTSTRKGARAEDCSAIAPPPSDAFPTERGRGRTRQAEVPRGRERNLR